MNSYETLKDCLEAEVLHYRKTFTWRRVFLRCFKHRKYRFLFWWRVASYLYKSGSKYRVKMAKSINRHLIHEYNTEIELKAEIGVGLHITHYNGIVVTGCCKIGKNFSMCQNTVIGVKHKPNTTITIGDNVSIGTNSCIIGENLTIGSNVTIGAMSFINKDIPSNCTVYTQKTNIIKHQ